VPGASGTDQQQALAAVHSTARLGLPDRLAVALTGPGGAAFDQGAVGAGIDSTLLIINVAVVVAVLLLTYRSPLLSLAPLLAVGAAVLLAQGGIYLLTTVGLVVNVQSASILTVLVFGVGTDYALLLTARYREELHRHPDRHTAMGIALRRALPAITASAATVAAALLCLLTGQLNSNRGLGPVGASGCSPRSRRWPPCCPHCWCWAGGGCSGRASHARTPPPATTGPGTGSPPSSGTDPEQPG